MSVGAGRNRTAKASQSTASRAAMVTSGANARTLTVRVPMDLRRRGGRKLVVVPGDGPVEQQERRRAAAEESSLVKLLARAFYWKRLFERRDYATLEELAAAEQVDRSCLSKVLRLTLLAPSIIEAIVDKTRSEDQQVKILLQPFPLEWKRQRKSLSKERP